MTSKLTREQRINEVKELIANAEEWAGFYEHPIHDKPQREMFEGMAKVMSEHLAALSAMDSEPVAWIVHARTGDQLTTDGGYVANAEGILGLHSTPLYRHAQPALIPYAWSYDWAHCVTCEGPQDFKPVIEREPPPQWAIDEGRVKNLITLYRTAQPAPVVADVPFDGHSPYDTPYKMPSNFRELIAEEIGILFSDDDAQGVWNVCRAAMLLAGNSPAIGIDMASGPDHSVEVRYVAFPGYVMVPRVPSQAHLNSIAMRYRHDFYLLNDAQKDSALATARQMYEECSGQGFYTLPAAKQESKP